MNQKFKDVFKGKVVNKALTINTGVDEFPRYVVEYLIDNYCSEETFHADMEKVVRRLIPNPAVEWLRSATTPTPLDCNHRTSNADLLAAAHAVRSGLDVAVKTRKFKVVLTPREGFAAEYVSNAIAWGGTPEVAIITPSREDAMGSHLNS